jgi:hypothetical protein
MPRRAGVLVIRGPNFVGFTSCQFDKERTGGSTIISVCWRGRHRALETAREQGALFWELRAALSLGRLRIWQNRPEEVRAVLAFVYDRFTEAFETADLRAARGILALPPV